VTLSTAAPNTTYTVVATATNESISTRDNNFPRTTTQFRMQTWNYSGSTGQWAWDFIVVY